MILTRPRCSLVGMSRSFSILASVSCVSLCLALVACDRSQKEAPAAPQPSSEPSVPETQAAANSAPEAQAQVADANKDGIFRHAAPSRVVAIGDLHGDFTATLKAFQLAGAVDESGKWVGKELVVVQTGDQLDRGDDEAKILSFLKRLKGEANEAGGAVLVLNGNHETMNVMGDFRYVTPAGLTDFAEWTNPASPFGAQAPDPYKTRASAFLPGGAAALELSQQPLVLMVGKTVFAHGGVLPAHVDFGIDKLNAESQAWMQGKRPRPPELVIDPEGPVWTRLYGSPQPGAAACQVLEKTLSLLGAERMVVGHTVQQGGMSGACQDRVYRIDVGLAHYYGDRPVQVLQIEGSATRILTAH